jgi:DNA replication protein DnaC
MGLTDAHVPPKYQEAEMAKVRPHEAVREYLQEFTAHVANGEGLVIAGRVGTGKSSIAALIAGECVRRDLSCRWEYVPEMVELISNRDSRAEVTRRQQSPDVLIWDDWGVAGLSAWQVGYLDRVVEHRYARRRPMIVTTNLAGDTLRETPEMARMVDRWRENGLMIGVSGESMRVKTA